MRLYLLLYNAFITLYVAGIRMASAWNKKAALWVAGRRLQASDLTALPINNRRVIWMHCASLGEFEQGRPVMEALRGRNPDDYYIVSFFSPSGYEVQKNYRGADKVLYLPTPGKKQAEQFISAINPALVLWVKYDYWYHYLHALRRSGIPVLLVSAIFRERQPFFHWYGQLHREMLGFFQQLFVQDEESMRLVKSLDAALPVTISGDTRFDRVVEIASTIAPLPLIERFQDGCPMLVAGSTWQEDEEELDHYCNVTPGLKTIIAPHHINEERLQEIEKLFRDCIRFSALGSVAGDQYSNYRVLIIDNIGMLSKLYRYATLCYVGGGFGDDGVHNVLEAAVYGKPVIHGPVYEKYREAIELADAGGAFPIATALEFESLCDKLLKDEVFYKETCNASKQYVYANSGATGIIMEYINRWNTIRKTGA